MRCKETLVLWEETRESTQPRRYFLAHVHDCPPCQELYEELEDLAGRLRALAEIDPPDSLLPRILANIRELHAASVPQHDAFAAVRSPIGRLYVTFRNDAITSITIDRGEPPEKIRHDVELRLRRPADPTRAPQWLKDTIDRFFHTWKSEPGRVDISSLSPFEQAALQAAAQIPPGQVRSYAWVAQAIGRPRAARAVGQVMARNPVPLLFPCHRVVDSSGALHNYGYGLEMKARLLRMEGYLAS